MVGEGEEVADAVLLGAVHRLAGGKTAHRINGLGEAVGEGLECGIVGQEMPARTPSVRENC